MGIKRRGPDLPRLVVKQHVIDDISYGDDYIVCTCAWKGSVDEFQPHRKQAIAATAAVAALSN